MSEYIHRMSLIVPESMIPQANQLALIAGESAADVSTFSVADYQDADGNLYAVCSTVIKPIVLDMLGQSLSADNAPLTSDIADIVMAQQAMDAAVMYVDGMTAGIDKIVIAIDIEPLLAFEAMGLTIVGSNADPL